MSSDTILKAPDGSRYSFDNLATQKWLDGHISGAEQIAGWLRTQSGERFKEGKDNDAALLRQLADRIRDEIVPDMRRRAEAHERDHPSELEPRAKRAR